MNAIGIAVFVLVVYLFPTLIAVHRDVPNRGSIIVVNVFLGWTFVGWVVALAMAARSVPKEATSEIGRDRPA